MASSSASGDLERLQVAEQKLLGALQAATRVVELLGQGAPQAELEALSSSFLADVQDSQVTLLELADRHSQPLPFQNNAYGKRLELLAAQRAVAAAEAQLQGSGGGSGGGRAASGAAAVPGAQ